MVKTKKNLNPFSNTFKHMYVAVLGNVSARVSIGIYSLIFTGIGYYLLKRYNKPNTKLLKELQPEQYVGLVFAFFGLLPFIQYFFISIMFEGGAGVVGYLLDE